MSDEKQLPAVRVGQRWRHPRFGVGVITRVSPEGYIAIESAAVPWASYRHAAAFFADVYKEAP